MAERRAGQPERQGQSLPLSGPLFHLKMKGLDGIHPKWCTVDGSAEDRPLDGQQKK